MGFVFMGFCWLLGTIQNTNLTLQKMVKNEK